MSTHVIPVGTYYRVYGALLILMFLTLGAAYVNLGRFNYAVSLAIAVAKATLIILYFMHIRYSSHMTALFATAAFLWLVILITLTLGDYTTRNWLDVLGK